MTSFADLAAIPVGAVLDVRPYRNGDPQDVTPAVVICKAGDPGSYQGERPVIWMYEDAEEDGRLINGRNVQPLYRDSEFTVRKRQRAADVLTGGHLAMLRHAAEDNEAANVRVFVGGFLSYLRENAG